MQGRQEDDGRDPVRGMGQGMLWIFWLLVLGGGTWIASNWSDHRERSLRTPESRVTDAFIEVQLRASSGGHFIADGFIDGHPVSFLLDTGATAVVVPARDAERIGLARGPRVEVRTASGRDHAWLTRIDSLRLGALELRDVEGAIAPGLEDTVLLGMSALSRLDLHQRDGMLILRLRGPSPPAGS